MRKIKIPIIIYSHSSYSDVWPLILGQFELYMPKSEIILFTDSDPLKGNYRPVFYDNKLNYNERVIQCLQKINDKVVLFTHEDMPLYSSPNFEILNNYISHIHSGKADSIKLIFAGWHFKSKKLEFDETLSKNKLSRFSIQPTLIKPSTLVKILKRYPSSNLWEFERKVAKSWRHPFKEYCCNLKGDKHGNHFDCQAFPYIATAIVKGQWNLNQYSILSELLDLYGINSRNYLKSLKLIIFDLDGVLIDAKNIHYDALNEALGSFDEKYIITWNEHLSKYDGLKTSQKLEMLSKDKGLPDELHKKIWTLKQEKTLIKLSGVKINHEYIKMAIKLKNSGYKLAVCSNSIRKTVTTVLTKLGIIDYMDLIISNEDVKNSKPHPEMYWKTISNFSVLPEETLIVEDSPYGLLAASRSNSNILRVKDPSEVNLENINLKIMEIKNKTKSIIPPWSDKTLNVLIPMAGAGSRFQAAGYTFPKPLIEVRGKPMIQVVVENLNIDANFIYVVQKSHREQYNLDTLLNLITPGCKVVEVDEMTEGAACTALLAKEYIDNENPLFFANSDQFVEWDSNEFLYKMNETNADGGIVSFKATHPKWSFAKVNDQGLVTEVAEKNPISDIATVGYYYWKKGSDFVRYAEQMIEKNIRVNNEFYVCPVFNEAIIDKKEIRVFNIDKMWGLGTPEDLNYYLENYEN